jgi:hypothetical protein
MKMTLLRSQKNDLFTVIKEIGLDPSDFEWSDTESRWHDTTALQIKHLPTGYYFTFDSYQGTIKVSYYPSMGGAKETTQNSDESWEKNLSYFKVWAAILHKEYTEPDLWELALNEKKLIAEEIDDLDNSPFTTAEKARLSVSINELQAFLLTSSKHTDAQVQFITTRLKHLEDASHRMGRKDWITLAMGTLTNIVVGIALAPVAARELLRTAGSLLGWVVGNIQLLP